PASPEVPPAALSQQAWLGHRLPVLRVRAFNHLGPGQSDRFVAPSLAARIARNERDGGDEVAIGNMTPLRDVTDVRDVVRHHPTPGARRGSSRRNRRARLAADELLALLRAGAAVEHVVSAGTDIT